MRFAVRGRSIGILAPALIFIASACAQTAIAPTAPPATPAKPPAAATPQGAPAPTATAPSPTKPATTTAPAGGVSITDLANKAKGATEYSFNTKITSAGQAVSSKAYVKGTKMRNEMTVAGQKAVILLDLASKVAYTLLAEQKMAMKMDFSQAAANVENPGDKMDSLPSDSKFVGTDTVDGKPAAMYDVPSSQGTSRMWVWTERGLPLKVETTTPRGTTVVEYTDYQFGPQPDSLFELPPGTQVVDLPTGIPGILGPTPAPKK